MVPILLRFGAKNDEAWLRCVESLLNAMARYNSAEIQSGIVPPFSASICRYKKEPKFLSVGSRKRCEWFDDARIVDARGWGDCDDLAAYLCGSLLAQGIHARVFVVRKNKKLVHCVVRYQSGGRVVERDPSRERGM